MVTLLVAVLIYIGFSLVDVDGYTGNKFWASVTPCFKSKQHTARLIKLAHKTHLVLNSMGVDHWLMYGFLWGPLGAYQAPSNGIMSLILAWTEMAVLKRYPRK